MVCEIRSATSKRVRMSGGDSIHRHNRNVLGGFKLGRRENGEGKVITHDEDHGSKEEFGQELSR